MGQVLLLWLVPRQILHFTTWPDLDSFEADGLGTTPCSRRACFLGLPGIFIFDGGSGGSIPVLGQSCLPITGSIKWE